MKEPEIILEPISEPEIILEPIYEPEVFLEESDLDSNNAKKTSKRYVACNDNIFKLPRIACKEIPFYYKSTFDDYYDNYVKGKKKYRKHK